MRWWKICAAIGSLKFKNQMVFQKKLRYKKQKMWKLPHLCPCDKVVILAVDLSFAFGTGSIWNEYEYYWRKNISVIWENLSNCCTAYVAQPRRISMCPPGAWAWARAFQLRVDQPGWGDASGWLGDNIKPSPRRVLCQTSQTLNTIDLLNVGDCHLVR